MMILVDYILTAAILFGLLYFTLSVAMLWQQRNNRRMPGTMPAHRPPITVFKPLKGIDDQLEDNLRSFFQLDYPKFELLFGVNDTDDPAIDLVQKLRREFPDVHARLVVNDERAGLNPKVNNLINMYPYAHHDHLVISDSNVRVAPDYLTQLIGEMQDEAVGLVTSMVRGVGASTFGAILENVHLNSFIAGSVATINRLTNIPITIGKSMLMRRETLEQLGGFKAYRMYLLEDGLLGQAIRNLGLTLRTCAHPVENVNKSWSLPRFFNRHHRWGMMRRYLNVGNYLTEIFSYPIALSLLLFLLHPTMLAAALLGSVTVIKIGLDAAAGRLMGDRTPLYYYLVVPAKEIALALLWPVPFFSRTVVWRGNRFRIGKQTLLSPVGNSVAQTDLTTG